MRIDDGTPGPAGIGPDRRPAPHAPVPARRRARALAGMLLAAGLVATACTSDGSDGAKEPTGTPGTPGGVPLPGPVGQARAKMLALTNYGSCDALLTDFRKAALNRMKGGEELNEAVSDAAAPPFAAAPAPAGAPGSGTSGGTTGGARQQDEAKSGSAAAPAAPQGGTQPSATPGYSGTNTHEQGVDEPDLVKTDGKRVFTVADGVLRVVDVASRTQTGKLRVPAGAASELLLSGDRALLVVRGAGAPYPTSVPESAPGRLPAPDMALPNGRTTLVLVDLSGPTPTSLGELAVDGGYVDARQIGATARVVVRSWPRGPKVDNSGGGNYESRYTKAVNQTTVDDWLPGYTLKAGDRTSSGRLVECGAVSRPDTEPGSPGHTGASTLSVLSFDLKGQLSTGSPVTIAADADTVYASATNLFVAAGYAPMPTNKRESAAAYQPRTAIYQFDISGTGLPKHVASGDVDGQLLNQYSLSEYNNHLRVATTAQLPVPTPKPKSGGTGSSGGTADLAMPVNNTESAVTVFALGDKELKQVGRAGGLGRGERIYAVRFTGAVGYVVTFRQTDPLYTLDLNDPKSPKVVGELKINGYSAYLHPVDGGRLIGVGQDATDTGRRTGTQVSLFDVSNLADPRRTANFTVTMGNSEAEMDPHAFLYWPANGTLVIPLTGPYRTSAPAVPPGGNTGFVPPDYGKPGTQALVLRLQGGSFVEVGRISHPGGGDMRRSLVIGDALWTLSSEGVMVSDLTTLAQRGWVPFA